MNRIQPVGPPHAYKTWEVALPRATHQRKATCEEAGCLAYRHGWTTTVDESTGFGQSQAYYIRRSSGRGFTESKTPEGQTRFEFAPGQTCFGEHYVALDRPQIHAVRRGDFRQRIGERYVYDRGDQWRDDMAAHLDQLRRAQE